MDYDKKFAFIECVHSEESLWNIICKDFKNTNKKNKLWAEIGQKFNMNSMYLAK